MKLGLISSFRTELECLAVYLRDCGITQGDRVALLSPNHICYLDLLFACGQLGAICVPLNWRLASSELEYIVRDCQPSLLVVHPEFYSLPTGDILNQGLPLLEIDEFRYKQVMQLSGSDFADHNMLKDTKQTIATFNANDPLAIIYTGGTTGRPKGVVLSHISMFWNATNTIISWNLTEQEVTPTYLPMFHTGGLNALSIPVLMAGGTVVIARSFDTSSVIRLLKDEHVQSR